MAVLRDYIKIKHGFAFKGKYISTIDNGTVLVTPGNFAVGGGFKEDKCKFYAGEYPMDYVLKSDDLIVTMTDLSKAIDTLGYSALVPAGERVYLHNQRIGLVTICDAGRADKHYLYWFMRSPYYQKTIAATSSGSTVHHTSPDRIMDVEIDLPDTNRQKTIAMFLDSLEEKININNKVNDNLEQQARTVYSHWRVHTTNSLYKLSEVAEINPETYSPKENWRFVNYLDTSSITSGSISEIQYIQPSKEKLPSRARRIIRKNDIVYSTVRPNQLHYGIIANPKTNMLGSTGFAVIRSKIDRIPNELIFLALTEPSFVEQMQGLAEQSVSTFPSIRSTDLDRCFLSLPSQEENDMIDYIKTLFKMVASNSEENYRLSELRDSLLPRLLSGEIDVSDLAI